MGLGKLPRELIDPLLLKIRSVHVPAKWTQKARAREIPHLRLGHAKIMFRTVDVRAILELASVAPDPVDRDADQPQTDAEIADLEALGLDPRSLARRRGGLRRRA